MVPATALRTSHFGWAASATNRLPIRATSGSPAVPARSRSPARSTASRTTVQFGDASAARSSSIAPAPFAPFAVTIPLDSMAVALLAQEERLAATFEEQLDLLLELVHRARPGQRALLAVGGEHEDPLGVPQDRDVRIVRHEDELP